jgi:Cys-rich protein (TIGR01571 family)
MVLQTRPTLVSAVLLNEPWSYHNVVSADGCTAEHMCCVRCHVFTQFNLLRATPLPNAVLWGLAVVDLLTLGMPCGFYPGAGSVVLGCLTRTQLRHRYRLEGTGARDLVSAACCSHFAARQQRKELEKEGIEYPNVCNFR